MGPGAGGSGVDAVGSGAELVEAGTGVPVRGSAVPELAQADAPKLAPRVKQVRETKAWAGEQVGTGKDILHTAEDPLPHLDA